MGLNLNNQMTWVDASAGTGKTKTLVDQVLGLLLQNTPLRKILCITFTKAAATEMKERVLAQLETWVTMDDRTLAQQIKLLKERMPLVVETHPETCRKLFVHVVDHIHDLRIQTIHSFCQEVLNLFPLEANIPPSFEMIEEAESTQIFKAAFYQTLGEPSLASYIKTLLVYYQPSSLETMLQELVSDTQLIQQIQSFEPYALSEDWRFDQEPYLELNEDLSDALVQSSKTDLNFVKGLLRWQKSPKARSDFEVYKSLFLTQKNEPRERLCTQKIATQYPSFREQLNDHQAWVITQHTKLQEHAVTRVTEALCVLTQQVYACFQTLKKQEAFLDYNDLIQLTSNLLSHAPDAEWIRFKLDGGIDHILIDEAQDTSPIQWQILLNLMSDFFTGESAKEIPRSVFVVGDPKQSIYSFQGADSEYFRALKKKMQTHVQATQHPWKTIKLEKSFRSNKAILDVVDHILSTQAKALQDLVEEFHDIQHESARYQDGGIVEVWPLITSKAIDNPPESIDTSDDSPPLALTIVLAQRIAAQIKGLLDSKTLLPSQNRPATAGDILILVQRRNRFMYDLIKCLKSHNIPVHGPDRLQLCDQIYIKDLIAFGSFLILPEDDFNLACLLKSPLFGFSDQDLECLQFQGNPLNSLWQKLRESPQNQQVYEFLKEYLNRADYLTPFELYQHLMIQGCGRQKFRARFGPDADDAIDSFLNMALDGATRKSENLRQFLMRLIQHQPEIKRDFSNAGSNAVRIMTVHGAKGLQAPIVFMPDTTRIPKELGTLLWDESRHQILWNAPARHATEYVKTLKSLDNQKMYTEYLRLLYVALTRPQDQLYVCGWQSNRHTGGTSWYDLIQASVQQMSTTPHCENEILSYITTQNRIISYDEITAQRVKNDNLPQEPAWLKSPAPYERSQQERLSPSDQIRGQKTTPDYGGLAQAAEGTILHKLIEKPKDSQAILTHFKVHDPQKRLYLLDLADKTLKHPEFINLLRYPHFKEVPLIGTLQEKTIKGQIDLLVIQDKVITLIDYKSDKHIPKTQEEVPEEYRLQLKTYKDLVSLIYPDKEVICKIFWIFHQKFYMITTEF